MRKNCRDVRVRGWRFAVKAIGWGSGRRRSSDRPQRRPEISKAGLNCQRATAVVQLPSYPPEQKVRARIMPSATLWNVIAEAVR
jgi:hypothetical protein